MSKKSLIAGTLILTGASFITRILGFIFRIYMSNIMGAEGMGLYQLVFPIYMLIWATSSAGLALAVSKKVAEFTSKKQHRDAIKTLNASLLLVLPLSLVISVILFFGANPIATKFVHEPKTMLSIKLLASCVPFMATACCIKGYFQGRQEMTVPALTQIGEQVARMVIIYLFSGYFIPKGLEYACALGVLGMCVGEFSSCIFAIIMYKIKKSKLHVQKSAPSSYRYANLASTLFTIAVPITANRFLTSSLQSVENILIPIQLQRFGLSPSSALGTYGMFSGMALPLLFFPSMVTASISTVLVPAISEAVATRNKYMLQTTLSKAIQFSALIGVGATALFLTFPNEIAMACYGKNEVGELLKLLAIICPFLYLQNILTGAMNGLGLQRLTFKGNVIGSAICIALILLIVPLKGIVGFMIAMLVQSGFVTIYHLSKVLNNVDLPIDILNWVIKPIIAATAGSLSVKYIFTTYLAQSFSLRLSTFIAIMILGIFYVVFLFLLKSVTIKDVRMVLSK